MNRFSFLTRDADRTRLPVALLSLFLGSGKTTLVNALLKDPRMANTAVAVNEFGEIPLDRDLIDHGADKTVVMADRLVLTKTDLVAPESRRPILRRWRNRSHLDQHGPC